jgi:hypothetical protein
MTKRRCEFGRRIGIALTAAVWLRRSIVAASPSLSLDPRCAPPTRTKSLHKIEALARQPEFRLVHLKQIRGTQGLVCINLSGIAHSRAIYLSAISTGSTRPIARGASSAADARRSPSEWGQSLAAPVGNFAHWVGTSG